MSDRHDVDSTLAPWSDLKKQRRWAGILVGNGASRAIWDPFQYTSLYEKAASGETGHPLSAVDRSVFDAIGTRNFETVLAALATADIVGTALKQDTKVIRERYESIQMALIDAVNTIHVPWERIPKEKLDEIAASLRDYDFVYSTNYDLVIYWAIMSLEGRGFKDFFWGNEHSFDLTNTHVREKNTTKVLYLHGALHLYHLPWGRTLKRTREPFVNLLELFKIPHEEGALPLFVTEGTSEDKLMSIYRSDYLASCHEQFTRHKGPLVVFGQALGLSDQHLVDAIRSWDRRHVAVSMMPRAAEEVMARKRELRNLLPEAELDFFDATTHPLGSPDLRIPEEGEENL